MDSTITAKRKISCAKATLVYLGAVAVLIMFSSSASFGGAFVAFGPQNYSREAGKPDKVTASFSILNPNTNYTLRIDNGGMKGEFKKVSSAVVTLNGVQVVGTNAFNQNVAVIEKPIKLSAKNDLTVELSGKPGDGFSLQIIGVDNDLPTITATVDPPPNAAGWNRTNVTVSFQSSDATSGIASSPDPITVNAEGTNQVVSGTAVDRAGNKATVSVTVNIDKTPPGLSSTVDPPPNSGGWNHGAVTVSFKATDNLSGVKNVTLPITLSTEGANQKVSGTATDLAGNSATADVTLNVDKTSPTVTIASPADGTTLNTPGVTITGAVSDPLSGVSGVTCNDTPATVSGSTFTCDLSLSVGANPVVVRATDAAGNVGSASITDTFVPPQVLRIDSVEPTSGEPGSSVVLRGKFEGPGPYRIMFGSVQLPVLFQSADTVTAIIPLTEAGAIQVALLDTLDSKSNEISFTVKPLGDPQHTPSETANMIQGMGNQVASNITSQMNNTGLYSAEEVQAIQAELDRWGRVLPVLANKIQELPADQARQVIRVMENSGALGLIEALENVRSGAPKLAAGEYFKHHSLLTADALSFFIGNTNAVLTMGSALLLVSGNLPGAAIIQTISEWGSTVKLIIDTLIPSDLEKFRTAPSPIGEVMVGKPVTVEFIGDFKTEASLYGTTVGKAVESTVEKLRGKILRNVGVPLIDQWIDRILTYLSEAGVETLSPVLSDTLQNIKISASNVPLDFSLYNLGVPFLISDLTPTKDAIALDVFVKLGLLGSGPGLTPDKAVGIDPPQQADFNISTEELTGKTGGAGVLNALAFTFKENDSIWNLLGVVHIEGVGTQAPFTVVAPNRPPTVSITSPSTNSAFTKGQTVALQGSGNDPEDGALNGSSLVWTSSLDGKIGTGGSLSITSLSVGTHTISLTATDSKGASASTSITVTIQNDNAPPSPAGGFGFSVAAMGHDPLVGSPEDSTNNDGIVFRFSAFNGTQYTRVQTYRNPNPVLNSRFGYSVAAVGNNVLVGAPGDGVAYLFEGSTGKLLNTFRGTVHGGQFGWSVALAQNTYQVPNNTGSIVYTDNNIAIGAPGEGKVYLFAGDTTGALLRIFQDPGGGGFFGRSVSSVYNGVLVGAPGDSKAYLFNIATGDTIHTYRSPTPVDATFGYSIAGMGYFSRILIGAPGTNKAYLYGFDGSLIQTLSVPQTNTKSLFGYSVAAGTNCVVVGAPGEDAIYFFDFAGGFIGTILGPNPGGFFGGAVAAMFNSNLFIVGGPWTTANTTGSRIGAVYANVYLGQSGFYPALTSGNEASLAQSQPQPTIESSVTDRGSVADFRELLTFSSAFGTADSRFDYDADGRVGRSDFRIFEGRFGKPAQADRSLAQTGIGREGAAKPAGSSTLGVNASAVLKLSSEAGKAADQVEVVVRLTGAAQVRGYDLRLTYDASALALMEATGQAGSLFAQEAGPQPVALRVSPAGGETILADVLRPEGAMEGDAELVRLTFRVLDETVPGRVEVNEGLVSDGSSRINALPGAYLDGVRALPLKYALGQNYPNPFNPATQVVYQLPKAGDISLIIYNLLGQQVRVLAHGRQEAGYYRVAWDGRDAVGRQVSSGLYFYRLTSGSFAETRKMMLLK